VSIITFHMGPFQVGIMGHKMATLLCVSVLLWSTTFIR